MSKRRWFAIGVLIAATAALFSGVVAVAASESGSGEPVAQRTASSDSVPNPEISKGIYGRDRAYVGDGQGGIAGWIDPTQLGAGRDPKVYDDAGNHIGYWVDNLGFVDKATHDSLSYDPDALRVARLGPDAVQAIDGLKAQLDACLDTHTAAECAAAAGAGDRTSPTP
jgi:hypothetical protein